MSAHDFTFCDIEMSARASGALYIPQSATLVVSDLHLCKSERFARKGRGLLPPYETRDTLTRLDQELTDLNPERVICLGDSFDDVEAIEHMPEADTLWLSRMQAGREWIWIAGNHDAGPVEIGGEYLFEVTDGPLTFRHIAEDDPSGEISGHYHPKHAVRGVSRPAFVYDSRRMIMPAFGTFTGGMFASRPPLSNLFEDRAIAVLTGPRAVALPLRS